MTKIITTERIHNGQFVVLADEVETQYRILNGSLGLSGNGRNEYGIQNIETGKITWIGSLAKCKKTVALWLNK